MNPEEQYWEEVIAETFESIGVYHLYSQLTQEQRNEIGKSLRIAHDCHSLSFYNPPDSDRYTEIEREYKNKIKEKELELDLYRIGAENAMKKALKLYSDSNISINKNGEVFKDWNQII